MKKNLTLISLMLGVMLLAGSSAVSADYCSPQIIIDSPSNYDITNDVFVIDWHGICGDSAVGFNVYWTEREHCEHFEPSEWKKVAISLTIEDDAPYTWDVSEFPEGKEYCILIVGDDGSVRSDIVRDLTIDRTAPEVIIAEATGLNKPNEYNQKAKVEFEYSDNFGVSECSIDFGDGTSPKDCLGETQKQHQYGDNGRYTVTITVKDGAGNSASDSVSIDVKNVNPTVDGIMASGNSGSTPSNTVFAVGEIVHFSANNVWDVDADISTLRYHWDFDCEGYQGGTEDSPSFSYSEEGDCAVTLYVTDKDGGISETVELEIQTVAPEEMSPLQKAIVGNEFKFELDAPWKVGSGLNKKFKTEISGITNCEMIVIPSGMTAQATDDNKCIVSWTPNENQKGGPHLAVIKASNGTAYKYYSFNTMVYSWGIELHEGWNLISIPLMPTSTDINDVFADIYDNVAYEGSSSASILQYDAVEGKWYKARRYSPSATTIGFTWSPSGDKLSDVVPGYGYWVKMNNSDILYGIEEDFSPENSPSNAVPVASASWNLVGKYKLSPTSINPNKAFESLEGYVFEDSLKTYDSSVNNLVLKDKLKTGEGYWVRTKLFPEEAHGVLQYEAVTY